MGRTRICSCVDSLAPPPPHRHHTQIEEWASVQEGPPITVVNGLFTTQSVQAQLRAVHSACMIVGVHGAGLSYSLFSAPGTQLVEIRPVQYVCA